MFSAFKQGISQTIKESEISSYRKNGYVIYKDGKELLDESDTTMKELAELKDEGKKLAKENKELKKQVIDLTAALETATKEKQ